LNVDIVAVSYTRMLNLDVECLANPGYIHAAAWWWSKLKKIVTIQDLAGNIDSPITATRGHLI
jgi:hypothetical protein